MILACASDFVELPGSHGAADAARQGGARDGAGGMGAPALPILPRRGRQGGSRSYGYLL